MKNETMESDTRVGLSNADPRVKFIWFVVVAMTTLVPLGWYTLIFALIPLIAFASGIQRFAPLLSMVAMPIFLLVLGLANLITAQSSSPSESVFLVIRWAAMIYSALFFVSTTHAQEIRFLINWTRLPTGFGIALFFAIRTIPSALEQLRGLIRTMQARGLWPLSWSPRAALRAIRVLPQLLLGLLFAGALRTDQMWTALELRGGWAKAPVLLSYKRSRISDLLLVIHLMSILLVLLLSLTRIPK